MLSRPVNVYSITEVVFQPAIIYLVYFLLRFNGKGFLTGIQTYEHYRDDGDDGPAISLDLEEMEVMIRKLWTKAGFIAYVRLAE